MSDDPNSTPSSSLPVTFHTPMASSSSIGPRATTYEDIIEVLGPDADLLDYLPSADEAHQLFEHYDKTCTIKFPKGRSGTPKLLFGTYQEEDTTMSHVYVYLRSPSFDNKEPSMTFMKLTANLRFVVMGNRDINKTYESLELNDIWKPLIRKNGKTHLQALRGVLKVFYVRKGIKLSAPIPVRDPDLIQGCQMFKNYAEQSNHEANQSLMNTFGTDTPSSIASRGPSVADPVKHYMRLCLRSAVNSKKSMSTIETVTAYDTSHIPRLTTPPSTESNAEQQKSLQTPSADMIKVKTETEKSVAARETNVPKTPNPGVLHAPQLPAEEAREPPPSSTLCDNIRNITQSLSASRKARKSLASKIQEKTAQKNQHVATLKELQLEQKKLEAEMKYLEERINAEEQEVTTIEAQIKADSLAVNEKFRGEKRRFSEMTPEIKDMWQLAVEYTYDELNMEGETPSKRQKTGE